MKTYSRLRKPTSWTAEPPAKRRRILDNDASASSPDTILRSDAVAPSSPVARPCSSPRREGSSNTPSDAALQPSSPPSSPPPVAENETSPILLPKRRPTFSFFARRPAANGTRTNKPQPLERRSTNLSSSTTDTPTSNSASLPTKEQQPPPQRKRPLHQPRLTQLQLDLGTAPVQRTCKTCGMAYMPANAEDAALHKAFHAMNVGGIELGRAFVNNTGKTQAPQRVWEKGVGDGDFVVAVGRRDGAAARNRARRVLEVVEKELGAVEIKEEELWGQVEVGEEEGEGEAGRKEGGGCEMKEGQGSKPQKAKGDGEKHSKKGRGDDGPRADRFRAYLYVRGSKCVGLCLAERVAEAYRVLASAPADTPSPRDEGSLPKEDRKEQSEKKNANTPEPNGAPSSSTPATSQPPPGIASKRTTTKAAAASSPPPTITTSPNPVPAALGISRIWVSSSHRRTGVATALLDAVARDGFCCHLQYGEQQRGTVAMAREHVAFSQPTDSGARLARRWFGADDGWLVYW